MPCCGIVACLDTMSIVSTGTKRKHEMMSTTTDNSASSLSQSSAAVTGTGVVAALYRDALQSIFKFLEFPEFVRMCLAHPLWYESGRTMKSRNEVVIYGTKKIRFLVSSTLKHHISRLQVTLFDEDITGSLLLLREGMPHLGSLELSLMFSQFVEFKFNEFASFVLSPHLHELMIDFNCDALRTVEEAHLRTYISGCLGQIASHATQLLKLDVHYCGHGVMDCPLSLQKISTLTDLSFTGEFNLNQQIDLIRVMPSIKCWDGHPRGGLCQGDVQRLVGAGSGATPHIGRRTHHGTSVAADSPAVALTVPSPAAPQLQDLGSIVVNVDERMAPHLKKLTSLTRLNLHHLRLLDPNELLPHLPHLTILRVDCIPIGVNVAHLSTALSACTTLTDLTLCHLKLTSEHLSQFLPHLVSLVILRLFGSAELVSCQFLTTSIAAKGLLNLHTFDISYTPRMPIKEYELHLTAIAPSLEHLRINESSVSRWPASSIDRFTPGSSTFRRADWPRLQKFELYEPTIFH